MAKEKPAHQKTTVGRPRAKSRDRAKGWVPRFLIREARIKAKLSQHELARKLKVYVHHITGIENGDFCPSWGTLNEIGLALKCKKLSELVDMTSRFSKENLPDRVRCDPVSAEGRAEINEIARKEKKLHGRSSNKGTWNPSFEVRRVRAAAGYSMHDLASALGQKSKFGEYICGLENGEIMPSWDMLKRIGDILGCKTVGELVDGDSKFGQRNLQPADIDRDY